VAQLKQWLAAVQAQCTASRNQAQAAPPSAQAAPIQAQSSQPPQGETKEERRVRKLLEKAKRLGLVK